MKKLKYSLMWMLLLHFTFCIAQDIKPEAFWTNRKVRDFKRIQAETEAYYKDRFKGKGSGYKQWKRWEHNQQDRLDENGQVTNYNARNSDAVAEFMRENPSNNRVLNTWNHWGENAASGGLPGRGVLNCVAFDNDDANVIYTGGPNCGLWKTINGGTTWFNVTDNTSNAIRGISSIVVDHANDNNIYILTGDGDGGDSPSLGVWKSTNGGITWNVTGLFWGLNEYKYGYKMAMDPLNPNVLIVATSNDGIYRTTNGGVTWNNYLPGGTYYDVVYKPGSSTEVYLGSEKNVYKSSNGGITWTSVAYLPESERMQVGVTPNDPSYVYALGSGYQNQGGNPGFPGFIRSTNSGTNWSYLSTTPAICSYNEGLDTAVQAKYNIDFAIKPNGTSTVVSGAINMYSSTDGGFGWTRRTLWYIANPLNKYVHSDIHGVEYNPINNKLYVVSDGGIYVSTDDGVTYTDITSNMKIDAFFDLASTPLHTNYMLGGLYHNGTKTFHGQATSLKIFGGDGTGCMMSHSAVSTIYYSYQNGNIFRSTNGGISGDSIDPTTGDGPFVTKMAMSPTNSNNIFVGWTNNIVYFSYDQGTSYLLGVLPGIAGESVKDINVASDGITVFACTDSKAFISLNGGILWYDIFTGSNLTSVIPISPTTAIITRGGYNANEKVYLYSNGSVTNISYNLPNMPVWTSAFNNNGFPSEYYIGTDMGAFKMPLNGSNTWTFFGSNIVNIPITELAIYPNHSKLRAATFGRGIWETDITCKTVMSLSPSNDPNNGMPQFQYNQASSQMTVDRKVEGNVGNVTYKAGNTVFLTSGFYVKQGNKVIVKNAGCGEE